MSAPSTPTSPRSDARGGWVVVVPVKPPVHGKSRLQGVDDERRTALATAFALDTVEACLAAPSVAQVVVVTDDAAFAVGVVERGAHALPDGVSDDLNATLVQAVAEARRRWPDLRPVALCADLPALRPGDLEAALTEIADDPAATDGRGWFVADAEATGTTLYAGPTDAFAPRYGPGSAAVHTALGLRPVTGRVPSLRRDVDDLTALADAAALGLGAHSAAAATGLVAGR